MKLIDEAIDLVFLSLTKTARILNIRAKKQCFLLYIAVDFYWLYIDLVRELYSQALFAVVAMFMHAYGYWYWSNNNIGARNEKNKDFKPYKNSDNEDRGLRAPPISISISSVMLTYYNTAELVKFSISKINKKGERLKVAYELPNN